jgi:hypothetical protein
MFCGYKIPHDKARSQARGGLSVPSLDGKKSRRSRAKQETSRGAHDPPKDASILIDDLEAHLPGGAADDDQAKFVSAGCRS